jgi:hypothetical protein
MHAPAPVYVQTTQGATGKFLDPSANFRSCLMFVGLVFFVCMAIFAWTVLK